ncbi:MAG TPA: trypsin-like peptidase domain-containing protein [Gemmataceae bacterium]|nr:trypsin-like peptidase domain-containing protein [Gemmataceae bacterium]
MIKLLQKKGCMILIAAAVLGAVSPAPGQESFAKVSEEVNRKVVKLYGSGGFQGLASYGTGALVSAEGHILTVASHMLATQDLRVHLFDGRRYHAKVLVVEPELDAALVQIEKLDDPLPFFDFIEAAQKPAAKAGDWILAFSNQFQIATRDEQMSVQRGVIAAYSKLHGRRGIFDAPYTGDVYVLDAITNNPGAGGGVITTRQGELLGIIGKELRNTLTETWINYAVPVQVLTTFVEKSKKGEYKPIVKEKPAGGPGGYHGIVLVPNVIERTPPFIEEVLPGSPAARAGLKPDDLVVYIDGIQVVSIKQFREIMAKTQPGNVLKLEVQRVNKEQGGDRLVPVDLKLEEKKVPAPPKK